MKAIISNLRMINGIFLNAINKTIVDISYLKLLFTLPFLFIYLNKIEAQTVSCPANTTINSSFCGSSLPTSLQQVENAPYNMQISFAPNGTRVYATEISEQINCSTKRYFREVIIYSDQNYNWQYDQGEEIGICTFTLTCTDNSILGCTDPGASNYSSSALCDDGSCLYPSTNCNIDDWTALKALYDSTDGDNWDDRTGWDIYIDNQTNPPAGCNLEELYGVALGDNKRLKKLILRSNELSGSIPSELGNLINLEVLDLALNNLSGNVPEEIGNLELLIRLNLSNNQFIGSIPPEIGNLELLRHLSFFNSQLIGSIPSQLGNLTNLQDLSLGSNNLSGSIPPGLGNLPNLTFLNLSNNKLSGGNNFDASFDDFCRNEAGMCDIIPCHIDDWTALKALYQSTNGENWTNNTGWAELMTASSPPVNCDLSNLYGVGLNNTGRVDSLNLPFNQLSGTLPIEIGKLDKLQYLNLLTNVIEGSIPETIGLLKELNYLNFGFTTLSGHIPPEIGNLSKLKTLYIGYTLISGNIPAQLGNLSNLTDLDLTKNDLEGCFADELNVWCGQFENHHISNGNNFLIPWESFCNSGSNACFITPNCHLDDWVALKALYENTDGDNWQNNTGWATIKEVVPPQDCKFSNLYGVTLGANKRVNRITLNSNGLNGIIPNEIGSANFLWELNLSNNKLSGNIPATAIGNLEELGALYLQNNQLNGEIPNNIGHHNLLHLWLYNNQLTGEIPIDLVNSLDLEALYLQNNQLEGTIPAILGQIDNLDEVDFSNNQLEGCYPESLLNWCSSVNVTTSGNQFYTTWDDFCNNNAGNCNAPELSNCNAVDWYTLKTLYEATGGSIWGANKNGWNTQIANHTQPPPNCNLSGLTGVNLNTTNGRVRDLYLSNFGLTGNIPPELEDLEYLKLLELSGNQLNGQIPAELGNITSLTSLNIQNCQLSGAIPPELGKLINLQSFSLRGNNLSGSIPPELGNLTNLSNLFLNHNQLSGPIPPELGNLTKVFWLALSVNQLEGGIPKTFGNLTGLTTLNLEVNNLTGCYPRTIRGFCDFAENNKISYGNNFDANWDDYCEGIEGMCCPIDIYEENINWIAAKAYDIDGTLKAASKTYYNDLGKITQSQTLDIETERTWATQTMYDQHGRTVLQTLAAPTNLIDGFQYQPEFIEFDLGAVSPLVCTHSASNPCKVKPTPGTLGWYYSNQNTDDFYDGNSYQDVTEYPYILSYYSKLNPGTILRAEGGNKVDSNQDGNITDADDWPQAYSFTMPASEELSLSNAFNDVKYKNIKTTKTVARDVHGNENVVFADMDGKILAAARSGATNIIFNNYMKIGEQGYVDIHIPQGTIGIDASNNVAIEAFDLITETRSTTALHLLSNGFYRIAVKNPETYIANSITIRHKVNYYDYSLNEYDDADRLVKSYQPLGTTKSAKPVTEYEYNGLSQLVYTKSPDEGEAWFKYREDGQIRYSQNSKQKDPNADGNFSDAEFSYTNYDTFGRPVESGVIVSTAFNNANPDGNLPAGSKKEQQFTTYDVADDTALNTALGNRAANYPAQSFVAGNVAYTNNSNAETWYSYDVYGRVNWMIQAIEGLGTKTIDYQYHPTTGLVTEVVFQKNVTAEQFSHRYAYDTKDRLHTAETSTDGTNYMLQAEYFYYETGGLKRVELADGVQGVDYVYNLAGQLKAINHPGLTETDDPGKDANDLFGMQVNYHLNDYARTMTSINPAEYGTDQFNGNIKGIQWNNANPKTDESEYVYSYNRNNWLTGADFDPSGDAIGTGGILAQDESGATYPNGKLDILEASECFELKDGFEAQVGSEVTVQINESAGSIAQGDYDVSNLTYDANGNIKSLKRNKGSQNGSNAMDDLSYKYYDNKPNQLKQVSDAGGDAEEVEDITSQANTQNYQYNSIGQLVENKAEGIEYIYNTTGLVTEVQKDNAPVVKFYYNDRNHRTKKESYTNGSLSNTTYYVRDGSGSLMSIYNSKNGGNIALKEQPVYGGGRIGLAYRSANNTSQYNYQLTDHLGNVRAVFTKSGNTATMKGNTDYYPFGMPMPERNIEDNYRYAYQGQEKDPETGKEAFELRLWDSRIGRWLTTDPLGQYSSPYLGMGNNPITRVDPDGGFDWYRNKETGNIVWFDNTDYNFSNEQGEWKNVGANLDEVGDYLKLPTSQNFDFKEYSFKRLSGSDGLGNRGMAFAPIVIDGNGSLTFSLNVEGAGSSGFERIDGVTEITGVKVSMTLANGTYQPIIINNLTGNFSLTSLGNQRNYFSREKIYTFKSENFEPLRDTLFPQGYGYATGFAQLDIPLANFVDITNKDIGSRTIRMKPIFEVHIDSHIGFKHYSSRGAINTSNTFYSTR